MAEEGGEEIAKEKENSEKKHEESRVKTIVALHAEKSKERKTTKGKPLAYCEKITSYRYGDY